MAVKEFYDPATKQPVKARELSPVERMRLNWIEIVDELKADTGIPLISHAWDDRHNVHEVRLRGRADQYMRTEYGEMRLLNKGKYTNLIKNFTFKTDGKAGIATRAEMEGWQGQIMKWFKSLDGQRELKESETNVGEVLRGPPQAEKA